MKTLVAAMFALAMIFTAPSMLSCPMWLRLRWWNRLWWWLVGLGVQLRRLQPMLRAGSPARVLCPAHLLPSTRLWDRFRLLLAEPVCRPASRNFRSTWRLLWPKRLLWCTSITTLWWLVSSRRMRWRMRWRMWLPLMKNPKVKQPVGFGIQ